MNTTKTQSLEEWLQDCPDKIQFYSRFLDIKSDIKLTLEAEGITPTDEQLAEVLDKYMDSGFVENAEDILYFWNEYVNGEV